MKKSIKGKAKADINIKGKDLKIAIISSRFNETVTGNLIKGAKRLLLGNGVREKNIRLFFVPGAFEIPTVLEKICRNNRRHKFDGIITIGCVIKGETAHFDYISSAVSNNINLIASKYGIPVGFCVLTTYNESQASDRSRLDVCNSHTNKGFESAEALLEMIQLMNKI